MEEPRFVPLEGFETLDPDTMLERARAFQQHVSRRRSLRYFSDRPVSQEVIEECLRAAGSAPSGANLQPWHFVAVSDESVKTSLRERAESEERDFYEHRAPPDWLEALAPLGTDEHKPYLEVAPWLIAVFVERWREGKDGKRLKNYYPTESVGISTGILLTALHTAGLATLTHTPSPMAFLNEVLDRPEREKPFLLVVVGYPADDATVPDISRKPLEEIATFL